MDFQQLAVDKLAQLLREAEEEHKKYEERLERRDEDWPRWYAQYILERLGKSDEEA